MGQPAHIRNKPDYCEQSVAEHNQNTAKYAAEALREIELGETAYLAGLLHDVGKYTPEFEAYLRKAVAGEKVQRGSVNHTFAGVQLGLKDHDKVEDIEQLTKELVAYAVGAHHGLFDCMGKGNQSGFQHRLENEQDNGKRAIANFYRFCASKREVDERMEKAILEVSSFVGDKVAPLAEQSEEAEIEFDFYLGMLARLILSAVVEGDRRDTAEFMEGVSFPAQNANRQEMWKKHLEILEEKLNGFSIDSAINRSRRKISDQCREAAEEKEGIFRLNVPTGGGKTLSSLRFALAHAAKNNKSRIIYVMPLLSIIEQNVDVIRDYIDDDGIVLEHHSNVVQNQNKKDELDERELLVQTWDAPIIVTTLVQLLNTLFDGKITSVRRFHSLTNSILIFDEVQTVPLKMLSIFNLAVNFLVRCCGATVVLCSATQPCLEKLTHPIFGEIREIVPYSNEVWAAFQRTRIVPHPAQSLEEITEFASDIMEEANNLLIVCNLKSEAKTLFRSLSESGYKVFYLTATMCAQHRTDTLNEMRKALKRLVEGDDLQEKVVCCATQVIEAGVDISFERVIRLSAGMDNVVQAAGRCNRNHEVETLSPVDLIPCRDENLKYLKEIQSAKSATEVLLYVYQNNPAKYGENLSSDRAIEKYYEVLFEDTKERHDYKICFDGDAKDSTTLLDLLSSNEKFKDEDDSKCFLLNQAFQTAGKYFEVIDKQSTDVIVPYAEKGKNLILDLNGENTRYRIELQRELLKQAKRYTVSLYQWQLQELQKNSALIPIEDSRSHLIAYAVKEEFYDSETGIGVEPNEMPFLGD